MKNKILKIINLILLYILTILPILIIIILIYELISTGIFIGLLFGDQSLKNLYSSMFKGLYIVLPIIIIIIVISIYITKKEYKKNNYIKSIIAILFPYILLGIFIITMNIGSNNNNNNNNNNLIINTDKEKSDIKIRDTERIIILTDANIKIRNYYINNNNFPESIADIGGLPIDPKDGEVINGCKFGYTYDILKDEYGVKNLGFRLSTCLESKLSIDEKAKTDGGIYENKFEYFSKNI